MADMDSNDDVVFDHQTLRLIIGALAFAFPTVVIALTGKITTSISSSYHEPETRDVFVGFLFLMGGLLIAYKGHLQGEPWDRTTSVWKWFFSFQWLKVYQEDIVSAVGGFAGIFAALYPTARDGFPMDFDAKVHMVGAFILFSNVVYFCMVAFLRSLNQKLVADLLLENGIKVTSAAVAQKLKSLKSPPGRSLFQKIIRLPFAEIDLFFCIVRKAKKYSLGEIEPTTEALDRAWDRFMKLWRGRVYVVCGLVIIVVLAAYVIIGWRMPDLLTTTKITFIIETVALVFFGFAWGTASKFDFVPQLKGWLGYTTKEKTPAAQTQAA